MNQPYQPYQAIKKKNMVYILRWISEITIEIVSKDYWLVFIKQNVIELYRALWIWHYSPDPHVC